MQIPQTHIQKIKAGVHFTQLFFIFIAGCLALAVLTKAGGTSGSTGFFFALCFLTLPAIIYNIMVPMWTRAYRFANVYAYASLDLAFTILWFAAFIAVAAWNSKGISEGFKTSSGRVSDNKDSSGGGCASFAYGSELKCNVSRASVGFGVIIWLLFAATSAMSIMAVVKYRRTGTMPNGNTKFYSQAGQLATEDPNKDPWNADTDELEEIDERHAYGQLSQEDMAETQQQGISLLSRHESGQSGGSHHLEAHPGRPVSFGSSTNLSIAPPSYEGQIAASALSPGGYGETLHGVVAFPSANYDR